VLGSAAREQGRYARAVELHAESLAAAEAGTALASFRELGGAEGAAWSLISLGMVARGRGRGAVLAAAGRAVTLRPAEEGRQPGSFGIYDRYL